MANYLSILLFVTLDTTIYTFRINVIHKFKSKASLFLFDDDNNVYAQWTVEEDKLLFEGYESGKSIDDLCSSLKRGYNGVKARIKHLKDPNHNAFFRLFGNGVKQEDKSVGKLRPCKDIITRILWDPSLEKTDFSFVFQDRFDGLNERSVTAANDNVKGRERLLVKAIPEHRILQVKYKERIVWCKKQRIDLVFGSGSAGAATDSSSEYRQSIADVVSTYDDWFKSEAERPIAEVAGKIPPVYCLLEDVLLDFEAAVMKAFKGRRSSQISPKVIASHLAQSESFYASANVSKLGEVIWPIVARHCPIVLTLCPDNVNASENKARNWCRATLSEEVPVISVSGKSPASFIAGLTLKSKAVLLASSQIYKKPWEGSGGIFVHFSEDELQSALELLLQLNVVESADVVLSTVRQFEKTRFTATFYDD